MSLNPYDDLGRKEEGDAALTCYDARTGQIVYRRRIGGGWAAPIPVMANPAVSDGMLVIHAGPRLRNR